MLPTDDDHAADTLIGTLIERRYRVIRVLGKGGMGTVFEVEHERIGRRFALKTLHQKYADDDLVVTRFQREARAADMIGNDHIIQVSDMGHLPKGEPYIVMELLEGRDLADELDQIGRLPVRRALDIVMQACDALSAAHAAGIIHRDLKPENMYLVATRDGSDYLKLLDFGISKFRDAAASLDGHAMTETGTTIGTPYYMPPEQVMAASNIDARADVYSLGVVLFQLLTGRVPYEAPAMPALLVKILQAPIPSARSLCPDLPGELEAVLRRAMAKSPDERFGTAAHFASALRPHSSAARALTTDPLGGTVPSEPPGSRTSTPLPMTRATPAFDTPAMRNTATPQAWESSAKPMSPLGPRRRWLGPALGGALLLLAGLAGGSLMRGAPPQPAQLATGTESEAETDSVTESEAETETETETEAEAEAEAESESEAESVTNSDSDTARPRMGRHITTMTTPPTRPVSVPQRRVSIRSARRAAATATLRCGDATRTIEVAAGATASASIPADAECQVACEGLGGPRCRPRLAAHETQVVIQ